jgi:glycosyltransferase involved in cell wall biosynthesis
MSDIEHHTVLISVIVPVYNVEKYLETCFQSIIAQTYANLQIIAVNDGSTDASPQICDHFASLDSRIAVFHQANAGISAVRNLGLKHAKGKYILFVDSDDFLNPDSIQFLYDAMRLHAAQISIGNVLRIDANGTPIVSSKIFEPNSFQNLTSEEALHMMYNHSSGLSTPFLVVTAKLYESRLFEGLSFPEGKAYDDEFVNYKLLLKADKITFSTAYVYNYLIRMGSLTHLPFSLKRLDRQDAYEERIEVFKSAQKYELERKTRYLYFRDLTFNLIDLKKHLPSEVKHIQETKSKKKEIGFSLLKSKPISFKASLFILGSLFFSIFLGKRY